LLCRGRGTCSEDKKGKPYLWVGEVRIRAGSGKEGKPRTVIGLKHESPDNKEGGTIEDQAKAGEKNAPERGEEKSKHIGHQND